MEFLRAVDPRYIEQSGAFILLISVGVFILLERLFPYTKGVKLFRKGFWTDLVWYTILQSYVLKIVIFDYIIAPIKINLNLSESGLISHWPVFWLLCFFLITHDFYIYWFHRWQHHNKYLWRTHEAHHSVRNVDWLAGSRSHASEILINQTIEFLPVFLLLDIKTAAIIVPLKALTDAVWGMWIHSNINVKTGRLQYIINGPEMHQWHHANHKEVFYSNYATKFAFFDWIFGTAFLPGIKPLKWPVLKPFSFGLPYAYPENYFTQTIYAFFRFDFRKIERENWFRLLLDFRTELIKRLSPKHFRAFVSDEDNPAYDIDSEDINCHYCGQRVKYYYQMTDLHWHCDTCENTIHTDLKKFGIS